MCNILILYFKSMFLYLDFTNDNFIGFEVEKHFYVEKINNNKKTSERINELILEILKMKLQFLHQ